MWGSEARILVYCFTVRIKNKFPLKFLTETNLIQYKTCSLILIKRRDLPSHQPGDHILLFYPLYFLIYFQERTGIQIVRERNFIKHSQEFRTPIQQIGILIFLVRWEEIFIWNSKLKAASSLFYMSRWQKTEQTDISEVWKLRMTSSTNTIMLAIQIEL